MGEILIPSDYELPLQTELRHSIGHWQKEVSELLPSLPADIDVQFDNDFLVPGFGTGGAAWNLDTIKLAYDRSLNTSQELLIAELKATYYHETYHLARGVSFETTPPDLPALSNAIEEGAATKFEVVHADSKAEYQQYEDRATMQSWLKEINRLPNGFDYDWQRYKFFDPETGRKWILYKIGMFIVDEALNNNPDFTIEGLSELSCDDILILSGL